MDMNISQKQKPFNGIRIATKDSEPFETFEKKPSDLLKEKNSDAGFMDEYAMKNDNNDDFTALTTSKELFTNQ